MIIRALDKNEAGLLKDFTYEAIFIPEGVDPPPKDIVEQSELKVYYENFGLGKADCCLVAEEDGTVVGAVWARIMDDYGHLEEEVPSLAISLYEEYRGQGTGTKLMLAMIDLLKQKGYSKASLSVQKENDAVNMYRKVGFEIVSENEEEYLMLWENKF